MTIFVVFMFTISSAFGAANPEPVDLTFNLDNCGIVFPLFKKYHMDVVQKGITAGGFWLQYEDISGSTHIGTHVHAPCLFAEGHASIDDIPLNQLVGIDAAIIDITKKAECNPDAQMTIKDLKKWEKRTGRKLNNVIVLLRSNWDKRYPDAKRYLGTATNNATKLHFPGICPKAAEWLVEKRNISAVGTDTASLDYGPSQDYIVHRIFCSRHIYSVMMLTNLDKLPICGAKLYILPAKLRGACGAPSRIYAIIDKSSDCCKRN